MKYIKIIVLVLFCSTLSFSLSIKDLDKLDRMDSLDYASKAKEKANSEQFSQSYDLLKKASSHGLDSSEYENIEKYIKEKEKSYEARLERERLEKQRKEREEQALIQRQREAELARSNNSNVYITDWGYSFQTGDSIWGRNGIRLSNGREIYTWLNKQRYGMECYNLMIQGALSASASNCSNNINNRWAASCSGSGQFWIDGNQTDVVQKIVQRCGS